MTQSTPLPQSYLDVPIAHRGLHDSTFKRPENSRAAARAAVEQGYAIELDVQPSSDGVAMVFHDATLDRLTDRTGPITALTADELSQIEIEDSGEPIPTLAEILTDVSGRVPLLIEIKDQNQASGSGTAGLEAAVASALANYEGEVAVMSFNPQIVTRFGELAPSIPRGLVTCAYDEDHWPELDAATRGHLRDIADLKASGAAFISHEAKDLSRPRVADLRAAGLPVLSWTIRSFDEELEARRHADGITFEGYAPALP